MVIFRISRIQVEGGEDRQVICQERIQAWTAWRSLDTGGGVKEEDTSTGEGGPMDTPTGEGWSRIQPEGGDSIQAAGRRGYNSRSAGS